jgi:Raf kinase inhibitor-like YbhB/YbcL family protein
MKHLGIGVLVLLVLFGGGYFLVTSENSPLVQKTSQNTSMKLVIASSAFENNAVIPAKYTCDGGNVNPPLVISDIPEGTVSLALLMDDPDVPKALKPDGMFDHWVVYSIPVAQGQKSVEIPESAQALVSGLNGRGQEAYTGPCPPPEYEPTEHRYFFKVYALSTELSFLTPPKKAEVEGAIAGYVIDSAELIGRYDRKK